MNRMAKGVMTALVAVGGIAVARSLAGGRRSGWHVVTVDRAPEEFAPGGRLPGPIAQFGDGVEVRVRPTKGNQGTEVAARLRDGEPNGLLDLTTRLTGDDPRQAVQVALHQAKQQAETAGTEESPGGPRGRRI
jgi:hypothetical protein